MESQPSWHQRHVDLYEGIVVVLIGAVIFGGYLSYKHFGVEESSSSADQVVAPAARDEAQEELSVVTPTPRTNPFDETNPFDNPYTNPFE